MWGFDLVHDIVIATFPGSIMHREGTVKCSLGTRLIHKKIKKKSCLNRRVVSLKPTSQVYYT